MKIDMKRRWEITIKMRINSEEFPGIIKGLKKYRKSTKGIAFFLYGYQLKILAG